tara:strand:+ start:1540 stop:1884 length:345 start_codon:yes stop_codon:yes gene_type:complete
MIFSIITSLITVASIIYITLSAKKAHDSLKRRIVTLEYCDRENAKKLAHLEHQYTVPKQLVYTSDTASATTKKSMNEALDKIKSKHEKSDDCPKYPLEWPIPTQRPTSPTTGVT